MPPALALQQGGRGLPENPSQGRRPVPNSAATSNGPAPTLPPVPSQRGSLASSGSSTNNSHMPPAQVISLVSEGMRNALETESQAAEANAVGTAIKPGVTLDLSRKNIQKLPEEVVDLMKHELER